MKRTSGTASLDLTLLAFYRKTRAPAIRNKLLLDNLGFVHMFVRSISPGSDEDDLVQAATIGFLEAIERYDPSKGSLLEFARWRMLHEVQKANRAKRGISASKAGEASTPREQAELMGWEFGERKFSRGHSKEEPRGFRSQHATHGNDSGHPRTSGGIPGVEARMDLRAVIDASTPEEIKAMIAQVDDAAGSELADVFGLTQSKHDRDLACQRTRRAFAKSKRRLTDGQP